MSDFENVDRRALKTLSNNRIGVTKPAKAFAPLSKAEQIAKAKQEKEALRQAMIQERADKAARLAAERKAEAELKAKERQLAADAAARRLAAAKADRELRTARAKADAQDIAMMKKQKEDCRRESLAFRNQEASRIAKFVADEEQESLAQFHESVIVCGRAEFDDVSAQKKSVAARRRDSLAYRNKESARQSAAIFFKEGVAKAQAVATDSRLQRGDYDDVQALKKQAEQRKRESLAWRNQNASRQASIVEDWQAEGVSAAAEATEKARQDAADVHELKKQAEQRKRESLAWRNLEASRVASLEDTCQAAVQMAESAIVEPEAHHRQDIAELHDASSGADADVAVGAEIAASQPSVEECAGEVNQIVMGKEVEHSVLPVAVTDATGNSSSVDAVDTSHPLPTTGDPVTSTMEDQLQSDVEVPNGEEDANHCKVAGSNETPAPRKDDDDAASAAPAERAAVTKAMELTTEIHESAQEAVRV